MTITLKNFFQQGLQKNKKVESDFDKPVVIESEAADAVPEPEPIENILDDEPADEIEEVADVDAEREEASQSKRYISANPSAYQVKSLRRMLCEVS